jgi:hypothetical protein
MAAMIMITIMAIETAVLIAALVFLFNQVADPFSTTINALSIALT